MIEFTIRAAGRSVSITAMYESTERFCKDYVCDAKPDFAVRIEPADIEFERMKSKREDRLEGKRERSFSDAYLETIAVQRKIAEHLFDFDTLLFHGSVIAVDGVGYLFTAQSGTGKSTHARLWRELLGDRAVMINDDKPFLRMENGQVIAYGSPWNGKHGLGCNGCVPLRAICILQRGSENVIEEIDASQALAMLIQQSQRPADKSHYPQYMELLDRLSCGTAFYRLACNMNPSAAVVSYEGMSVR